MRSISRRKIYRQVSDVTDSILQETFSSEYPSVKGAKVIIDSNTGRTKGYGFVRFGDENERSSDTTLQLRVYILDLHFSSKC